MENKKTGNRFEDFFKFKNEESEIAHDATMISFQFISELNKVLENHGINKRELAKKVNLSPSYITQLSNGNKLINCETIAKIQRALGIRFKIEAIAKELAMNEVLDENEGWGEIQINEIINRHKHRNGCWIYKSNSFSSSAKSKGDIYHIPHSDKRKEIKEMIL